MGLTNAKVQLRNPRLPELEAVEIDALADTGALHHYEKQSDLFEAHISPKEPAFPIPSPSGRGLG